MTDRKVVLVTGAGTGIGRAAARHLSAAGFALGLPGRAQHYRHHGLVSL